MRNFFEQYSQVLVVIIVAIALIAICMGLKIAFSDSVTDLANNFTNKAQEILDNGFEDDNTFTITINCSAWRSGDHDDIVLDDVIEGDTWKTYSQRNPWPICVWHRDGDDPEYYWLFVENDGPWVSGHIILDELGQSQDANDIISKDKQYRVSYVFD